MPIFVIALLSLVIGGIYTLSQAAYNIKLPWLDFTGHNMFAAGDWMEMVTDRLILPVCALGECIFVGWSWGPQNIKAEVCQEGGKFRFYKPFAFLIKYLCPLAIASIILYSFITGTTIS